MIHADIVIFLKIIVHVFFFFSKCVDYYKEIWFSFCSYFFYQLYQIFNMIFQNIKLFILSSFLFLSYFLDKQIKSSNKMNPMTWDLSIILFIFTFVRKKESNLF